MRISDWSSDVCSSDLSVHGVGVRLLQGERHRNRALVGKDVDVVATPHGDIDQPESSGAAGALIRRIHDGDGQCLLVSHGFLLMPEGFATVGELVNDHLERCCLDAWNQCVRGDRSEEHTSELQSLMRISYAVFCLKKKNR